MIGADIEIEIRPEYYYQSTNPQILKSVPGGVRLTVSPPVREPDDSSSTVLRVSTAG